MFKTLKDGRVHEYSPDGFYIVKPTNYDPPIPLFCPFCNKPMRNSEDAKYYREYECCVKCGIEYAEENKEKWKSGWRPEIL